jgi:large subunit ribosomal protein L3
MGSEKVFVKNLKIMRVDTENNVLLVKGAVPGAPGGIVRIIKS